MMAFSEGAGESLVLPTGDYRNEYGFIDAMERHAALAPAPAVSVELAEIEQDKITEPAAGIPVWAALVYPDGAGRTVKAFAQKWTQQAVYVQYVERSLPAYTWLRPDKVRRRQH
jgi:hypothetical protein